MSIFAANLMDDKVVLVTGGGTGIGKGIAKLFGQYGAKVVIASRKQDVLDATAAELQALNIDCAACVCDIRDYSSVEGLIKFVLQRYGQLDVLVNNAAGNFPASVDQLSANGFRTVVDIDLNGTFNVTKAAFEHCLKANGGAVVNITAPFAGWGVAYQAHAAAAKAGIDSLTRSCAVEWQPLGIRVNAVAPGSVAATEGTERLTEALVGEGAQTIDCEAEDIANTVLFLASDAAKFISGEIIRVDSASGVDMLHMPVH
jgi:peroxisomal 2,4-dienoyl-CoA reductase